MEKLRGILLQELRGLPKQTQLIVEDQSTDDIIRQIEKKHYETFADYDLICRHFMTPVDIEAMCEGLYNFCQNEISYREESEKAQYVSSPATILKRGHCDCKGYALFCGGILDAMVRQGARIKWRYRFVSYKPLDTTPGHVFVVVKDGRREIWLDPVLGSFDYHKPYMWAEDLITELPVETESKLGFVGACPCMAASIGAGELQAGATLLSSAAPALALIPVAGPFIAVGAQLVGLFAGAFGNNYKTSEGVRWLTHLYQENVLGQNIDFNQVDENQTDAAHNWFNAVLGVPIYDKFRYHTLSGTDPNTGRKLSPFPSADTRAKQYLTYHEAIDAGVPYADALAAANIAASWPLAAAVTGQYGTWKNFPIAPGYAAKLQAQQAAQGIVPTLPGKNISLIWIAVGAAAVYFLLINDKTKII
jgi:hypothetical protein